MMYQSSQWHTNCFTWQDDGFGELIVTPFDAWEYNLEQQEFNMVEYYT